ncbi:MAG: class I SAM-dependent methyltransferase [Dehalococcoidia bacterium]|nr:class I SAM-dependent methyltransferase [Dehalococcoidia bacterium]
MADQSILHPGNLLMVQERERFLARFFRRLGRSTLAGTRVFEAGCSTGYNLRLMVQWGGNPEEMAGIDLDPEAAAYCSAHAPEIRVHAGSAAAIPESNASFDVALAFTLFSSVPDEEVSAAIAHELERIVRPGGFIIVYDMRRRSPGNPNVHPVSAEDIRRWFPRAPMRMTTITLAPPIARRLGRTPWLYGPLSRIPLLRTHAMYVLRRPGTLPAGESAAPVEA